VAAAAMAINVLFMASPFFIKAQGTGLSLPALKVSYFV
jgi:hypothetical protein